MRYADASAYDVLWADTLLVEESAIGGHVMKRSGGSAGRAKRAKKAAKAATKANKATKKKTVKKAKAVKRAAGKKGGSNA